MKVLLAVVLLSSLPGCAKTREDAIAECKLDCPTFDASFVGVSSNGRAGWYFADWSCYCRRANLPSEETLRDGCVVIDTDRGEVCSSWGRAREPGADGRAWKIW
jgi:hypothetical protein